jgi:uncharacterized membrane protein
MEIMSTMTDIKLNGQTDPDVMTRMTGTEDNNLTDSRRFIIGLLIGIPISLFLWVLIIFVLPAIY